LLILLIIPAVVAANTLIYNSANAVNQNPNQQTITESPTTIFSAETSNNDTVAAAANIPSAQSVYTSQSITLPTSVKSFVWYIVNEAHENTDTSSHKKISDHNPDYLPTNLVIPQGVNL
jgi:hypothetical protein